MFKEIIALGDIEIEKRKFHHNERPASIQDVNVNEMVASNKVPLGKKSFYIFH